MAHSNQGNVAWRELLLLAPAFLGYLWLVTRAKWFWTTNPELQFGWIVLLLCLYLFGESWGTRPPLSPRLRWWTVVLVASSAVLLVFTQAYWAVFGTGSSTILGLCLGVMGVCVANLGMVYGWPGVRHFGLAFLFIGVAMPMPGLFHRIVVGGLQSFVANVNTEFLNLVGIPARQVGSLIQLPNGTVGIDEACSGIRSLQSTIMASIFIGYVSLKRNSLRVLLFGAGVLLAVFGNICRSLYLSLTAHWHGVESIEKVHDAAGWSVLAFTAAGVALVSWLIGKAERSFRSTPSSEDPAEEPQQPNRRAVSG